MIVPAIGRGGESQILETTKAYEQVAEDIVRQAPETIIITTPHSVMYADYFHISPGNRAGGSFAGFGAPAEQFDVTYDKALVDEICSLAEERDFPAGTLGERDKTLDHAVMVPLWFIEKAYERHNKSKDYKLVRIGLSALPLTDHYRL